MILDDSLSVMPDLKVFSFFDILKSLDFRFFVVEKQLFKAFVEALHTTYFSAGGPARFYDRFRSARSAFLALRSSECCRKCEPYLGHSPGSRFTVHRLRDL